MKLITFTQGAAVRAGLAMSATVGVDLTAADPAVSTDWKSLFANLDRVRALRDHFAAGVDEQDACLAAGGGLAPPWLDLRRAPLLAPIVWPSKIVCVGLNYRDHAEEQNKPLPPRPMLFSKASTCLQHPGGPIELPADLDQVDAEAELAVVIGKAGRRISRERAREHIAGYTCFNDISDRAAQYADKQYFRGKSIDTGGPCGPWIVTPDELPDLAHGLDVTCRWNGAVMQHSNTEQLIFSVDELIAHASLNMTLLPGDIISTGTPGGVGVFRDPPVFLRPGDSVEVEVQGIGVLTNPVVAWEPPAS